MIKSKQLVVEHVLWIQVKSAWLWKRIVIVVDKANYDCNETDI